MLVTGVAVCLTARAALPYVTPGVPAIPLAGVNGPAPADEGYTFAEAYDLVGVWRAKVETTWYRNYPGNPYSSTPPAPTEGYVTIEYRLSNTSQTTDPAGKDLSILSIGLGSVFGSLAIGYVADAVVPDLVAMGGSGLSLNWVWGAGGLSKGQAGATLIVHTGFRSTPIIGDVSVAGSGSAQVYQVFVPVPEPSMYAGLFAVGLAGFVAYRRFRA